MIIIDIHEPIEIVERLKGIGVQVKVRKLSVGDYIIGNIGIERKSFHDFFRSIVDKRIFSQISRLKDAFEKPIVILEGDYENALYQLNNPNTIIGEIVSIVVDENIGMIYSRDKDETILILYFIWRHIHRKKISMLMRYKPPMLNDAEKILFIIQGFPGIGYKLADNIMSHYGTLRNFSSTNISELTCIEGIGKIKAGEIYRILNLDYRKLRKKPVEEE